MISIEKTNETFRLLYDVKGRFVCHRITKIEGQFKLCKVIKTSVGRGGVPYIVTHDARTIRYPDPHVKVRDDGRANYSVGKTSRCLEVKTSMAWRSRPHALWRSKPHPVGRSRP